MICVSATLKADALPAWPQSARWVTMKKCCRILCIWLLKTWLLSNDWRVDATWSSQTKKKTHATPSCTLQAIEWWLYFQVVGVQQQSTMMVTTAGSIPGSWVPTWPSLSLTDRLSPRVQWRLRPQRADHKTYMLSERAAGKSSSDADQSAPP